LNPVFSPKSTEYTFYKGAPGSKPSTSNASFDEISRVRPPSTDMDPPNDPRTPALRYSGSSSTTHCLDTPPPTPPFILNVNIVSVPISDVGTMDALVDGLNGFDQDDILYASSLHRHEQSSSEKLSRDLSNAP
jgi:hypothetical protein